jgi:hypothetical protein
MAGGQSSGGWSNALGAMSFAQPGSLGPLVNPYAHELEITCLPRTQLSEAVSARLPMRLGDGGASLAVKGGESMSTYAYRRRIRLVDRAPTAAAIHLAWLGAGVFLGSLVPYVLADRLELPKDVYYGLYSTFAIGLFLAWAVGTGQPLAGMIGRRWRLAVALGVVFAGVTALVVLAEDGGPSPDGLELVGAIVWRGLVYGFADGVLLSAFPILVVFAAFASTRLRERLLGKVAIGFAALAASVAMTAAYHLGYSDFRSEKVQKPMTGDLVWSVPTLITLNPLGAPIAHAGMHVTAVLHEYETDLFLPPHD